MAGGTPALNPAVQHDPPTTRENHMPASVTVHMPGTSPPKAGRKVVICPIAHNSCPRRHGPGEAAVASGLSIEYANTVAKS